MLQVAETSTVSCAEWLAMLDNIERSSIGRPKQSPVSRLFYLQSADKTASAILGAGTGSRRSRAEQAQNRENRPRQEARATGPQTPRMPRTPVQPGSSAKKGQQDSTRFARAYRKAGPIQFQSSPQKLPAKIRMPRARTYPCRAWSRTC